MAATSQGHTTVVKIIKSQQAHINGQRAVAESMQSEEDEQQAEDN